MTGIPIIKFTHNNSLESNKRMRIPVPILLYHSISDEASPKFARWTVTPDLFEAQVAYLREAGFFPLTVTDFVLGLPNWNIYSLLKPVVVTFDDGYADFYDCALPILDKYGFKATVYITTKYIGGLSQWLEHEGAGNRQMMSRDQIRALRENGIECGAHGHAHHQLDILPSAVALQEITQSKEILEELLVQPIYSFAYPHGYHSQKLISMVREAGYTSACAVKHALSSTEDDPFALARLIITPSIDLDAFRLMLAGENVPVSPYPERVRTKAWRGMRWLFNHFNSRAL